MSSTRQAVVRARVSRLWKAAGFNPRPPRGLETGIGPSGPRIDLSRTKPVSGKVKQFRTKASYSKAEAGSRDLLVRSDIVGRIELVGDSVYTKPNSVMELRLPEQFRRLFQPLPHGIFIQR